MAFTRGLFYPWIDIPSETWLKTAALYWDHIQTIVPEGIHEPYKSQAARALYDEGVLEPLIVNPDMQDIQDLASDVRRYLDTAEGIDVLGGPAHGEFRHIHSQKMPREVQEVLRLHPAKIAYMIRDQLQHQFAGVDDAGWFHVDSRFAAFYMTLLASRLAGRHGLGLLTDTAAADPLATAAKLDVRGIRGRPQWHRRRYAGLDENPDVPPSLAEGLLAHVIIERLQVDPSTSINSLIKFRREHATELGRFRQTVGELVNGVNADQPLNHLLQSLQDTYLNEVAPSIQNLKRALSGEKIKFAAENILKVSCFSLPPTSLPLMALGVNAPVALLAGAGVSLVASVVLYNESRRRQLTNDPYAYILAAERAFL